MMMEATSQPAASVVIPAYQAADFVAQAIRSALDQTRADLEVVVVDDASTDGTWEVVSTIAAADARVRPFRLPRQSGPGAARNFGICQARGSWIALLDADDLFAPDRLERMIARAEAEGADLLADNLMQVEFDTGAALGPRFRHSTLSAMGALPLVEILRRDMPDTTTPEEKFGYLKPIIRRDFLHRYGLRYAHDIRVGEDFLFYYECVAHGGRFHVMPEALYTQRIRTDSLSGRSSGALHLSMANQRMARLSAGLSNPEIAELHRRRQRLMDMDCFVTLMQQGRPLHALRYLQLDHRQSAARQARIAGGIMRERLLGRPRQDAEAR